MELYGTDDVAMKAEKYYSETETLIKKMLIECIEAYEHGYREGFESGIKRGIDENKDVCNEIKN